MEERWSQRCISGARYEGPAGNLDILLRCKENARRNRGGGRDVAERSSPQMDGCLGVTSTGVCQLEWGDGWVFLGLLLSAVLAVFAVRKLATAFMTLRAMAWTPTLARRLSKWVKSRAYSDEEFFRADGAEGPWIELRAKAIKRLAVLFQAQYAKSIAWGNEIGDSFSDLRFTDANRVPFPFVRLMRKKFNLCSVVTASDGPK